MSDIFGTVILILLSVYLMFISPVFQIQSRNTNIEEMLIISEINYFTDNIRNTGVIKKENLTNLYNTINSLSKKYNIFFDIIKTEYGSIVYINSKKDIEKIIESKGKISFEKGEYIKIRVESQNKLVTVYGGLIKKDGIADET